MENSWTPPSGRHAVNIGKSMGQALKARKSQNTVETKQKPSAMPVSDFYLFRYNFKPESVDSTKPGMVEMANTTGNTTVRVERASIQPDEVHIFRGKEEPAKEVECVLIYNEDDGMFTLEKLDSYINLTYEKKDVARPRGPTASPEPSSLAGAESPKHEDMVEAEILQVKSKRPAKDTKKSALKLESSPLEEDIHVSSSIPPTTTKPQPKLKSQATNKKTANVAASVNSSKVLGKHERETAFDIEEEDLEFGKPARQTKRAHPSPQPQSLESDLILPTVSSSAISLPSSSTSIANDHIIHDTYQSGSEGQDEWDEVVQPGDDFLLEDDEPSGSIFGDAAEEGGEEIDMNEFAAELDQELEDADEDADGDIDAESGVLDSVPVIPGRPMSLNQFAQFARGEGDQQDEDEYSSSEDSSDGDD